MSNLMPEVTLVHFTKEKSRTDREFVEYQIIGNKTKSIRNDRWEALPSCESKVYRAEVKEFKTFIPSTMQRQNGCSYTSEYIALSEEAQYIVDMYINNERQKYISLLADLRELILKEQNKTLWTKLKETILRKKTKEKEQLETKTIN